MRRVLSQCDVLRRRVVGIREKESVCGQARSSTQGIGGGRTNNIRRCDSILKLPCVASRAAAELRENSETCSGLPEGSGEEQVS